MEENKQKTVVAFIAGLLIGGLLVWVFSISPEDKKKASEEKKEVASEETTKDDKKAETKVESAATTKTEALEASPTVVAKGSGSVTVEDQAAGGVVTLAALTMPIKSGWIVVHEVNADGSLANILGASRYGEVEGLKPMTVELLRKTEAGKTYKVVVYSENGDRVFDKKEDVPVSVDGGSHIEDAFMTK